jgi:uncharacterized protein
MGRVLVILLVIVGVVWLLRRALGGRDGHAADEGKGGAGAARGAQAAGDLVRCAHCGVNLPRAEAVLAGDRIYCGEEHRRAGPREG